MKRARTTFCFGLGVLLLCAAPPPLLAEIPPDAMFSGFVLSGDYTFELAGKTLTHAEIYHSDRAASYLVIAPELKSPLLINPRTQTVESVHLMKVAKREDGSIDLLADATLDLVDRFQIAGKEVHFTLNDKPAKLLPKPWLLGSHAGDELLSYNPEYARLAAAYTPSPLGLTGLRGQTREVRVRVYFGSWCPACKRLVPRLLRVSREIAGSKIRFEYYGLPSPVSDDPEANRLKIDGVPTAIIYLGDREIGRLMRDQWDAPEVSLLQVLNKAS